MLPSDNHEKEYSVTDLYPKAIRVCHAKRLNLGLLYEQKRRPVHERRYSEDSFPILKSGCSSRSFLRRVETFGVKRSIWGR